ncbi:hypothetical protein KMW28_27305 [Flammeovirga yaeyamensis]|uniref:Uncharacterized protein n=1 Tax=Flammeovirga yaeyamensis TaxID=367791 RepID=A0AAX1NAV6_9BACT|nr:hypothetical protein [Flammeovirga yaeyamensis]MBB3700010.1 hypothetical protein [Flammeovirga yaeyamensis]NMF37552.1 hypothetical protein [Flammeovirga yaeyamensis]QWG04609.1 hypothetical protein KMW28_27305 [Flammeovirga yaeyamensis]
MLYLTNDELRVLIHIAKSHQNQVTVGEVPAEIFEGYFDTTNPVEDAKNAFNKEVEVVGTVIDRLKDARINNLVQTNERLTHETLEQQAELLNLEKQFNIKTSASNDFGGFGEGEEPKSNFGW